MEYNGISMFMDVKLDIHDKRPHALKYKTWIRCQVKIEAIKCVPCFLRLTFQRCVQDEDSSTAEQNCLTVSINVPGVTISLATSRTKQHSYGIFWTQNRRDCFIYFAMETEASCRRHMKWIKKSIKNLELYRQIFLEQRRLSRGSVRLKELQHMNNQFELDALHKLSNTLDATLATRVSDIYEEIFDSIEHSRLSRRYSRSSIASGIYEEMKPSAQNFISIIEEPPALPPLPGHRKRINTFEHDNAGCLGDIPRSNTNPESDMAKKKKSKNMLDNIFGVARQKHAESLSECEQKREVLSYENALTANDIPSNTVKSHRNSFSSPDLSQLNFLDTFDEEQIADILLYSANDSTEVLCEQSSEPLSRNMLLAKIQSQVCKTYSLESLNVSEQLPNNFNFSACNTSTINLIGAHGAVPQNNVLQKNNILVDDMTGYCIMAPIIKKTSTQMEKPIVSTESTSSGYSTGSYCSSSSSCNNEDRQKDICIQSSAQNNSAIYELMHGSSLNTTINVTTIPTTEFSEHLYENLLSVKAAQELEQPGFGLSTSTPTDSPQLPDLPQKDSPKTVLLNSTTVKLPEDYYQTPRKSIISVDDKIPSYYPNSCDLSKIKRRSPEPYLTPPTNKSDKHITGLRNLVNIKIRNDRKEIGYITSPQANTNSQISVSRGKTSKTKKSTAHKISENVYAVTHTSRKKSTSNSGNSSVTLDNNSDGKFIDEIKDKLQADLRHMALLKNIDFRFDDGQETILSEQLVRTVVPEQRYTASIVQSSADEEYENCYQAAEGAARLLQKYATLARSGSSPLKSIIVTMKPTPSPPHKQHLLQVNQSSNISPVTSTDSMTQSVNISTEIQLTTTGGVNKKFASLPRFKKIDFSPLKQKINNVLQRNQQQQQSQRRQQH